MKRAALLLFALKIAVSGIVCAQVSTGSIAGLVTDVTGASIRGAIVVVVNEDTGLKRMMVTGDTGDYRAAALLPGTYEVSADAQGFSRLTREAIVQAGSTTVVNLGIKVGARMEALTVTDASPQMHYESHELYGTITRPQMEGMPLNGRNFLELIKLEPGAQQPARTSTNRILTPLLGSPVAQNGRATRVTVDGVSIMEVGNGGAAMGFSPEAVQEIQVSSANFDLSTGATASGAVNVATRAGNNDLHGSGFFFFRDHHLSAYPGLRRDLSNPDPFFQRRQYGLSLGGPIRRNRAFFFGAFERNEQRGVVSTVILTPEFAQLSGIFPSPTYVNQFSGRVDFQLAEKHSVFLRHSHQDSFSFAPNTISARVYPSAWTRQLGWADQSILGITSPFSAALVNDLRFSYFFVSYAQQPPETADCPRCVGIGAPSITVSPDLSIGVAAITTVLGRRYQVNDVVSWQRGRHHLRFGGDWETARGGRTDLSDQPVTMTLFSPKSVRDFNATQPAGLQIPLPASFLGLNDILRLPLQNFTVGIGDIRVPQVGFGEARISSLVHLFYEDTCRLHPRFFVNYGLGWLYDAPLNYDLHKPAYLLPILGSQGLSPTKKNWTNFSPSVGFAWNLKDDGKTVIRGGVGVYYDFQTAVGIADEERVSLGPRGVGRGSYFSGGIGNPLSDVPGVPQGTLLDFSNPTFFTAATALGILPTIRENLAKNRGDAGNRNFSVTNIETDKQGQIIASGFPTSSATHMSIGVQREIARELVVSADFVVRKFRHIGTPANLMDANHFSGSRGSVLPICLDTESLDPKAQCSLGPIFVTSGIGNATYRGLLLRAEKRFSGGKQLLASYAYSRNVGDNFGNGFNNEDPLGNYGPLDRDVRHILSFAGLVQLPKGFQVGFFVTYNSTPPFSAFLGGLDLNGDGTADDLLPGTRVNQFNRSLGKQDLRRLVDAFNGAYAGKQDGQGSDISPITLPLQFEFGDSFLTQDLRLSRNFVLHEHWRMTLLGEVFNLCNVANLGGRSGDLLGAGFGQPTSRVTQVFGSGGPRAFQLAARIAF